MYWLGSLTCFLFATQDPRFIEQHVAATISVIEAAEAADADNARSSHDQGHLTSPCSPSTAHTRSPVRLIVVGGAGVMARSTGAFVTETLPGSAVQRVLPIYGAPATSNV